MEISKRIVSSRVLPSTATQPGARTPEPGARFTGLPTEMHEGVPRPKVVLGRTHKIVNAHSEHAVYVTINNVVLGDGEDAREHPYEVFINSKAMEHFQWVVALTRIMSGVLRKGGEIRFMAEELKSIHDPAWGFYERDQWIPSLVAQIGQAFEEHLAMGPVGHGGWAVTSREVSPKAQRTIHRLGLCPKCQQFAVELVGGCETCRACGYSKCD